jgi:hypothetical protein
MVSANQIRQLVLGFLSDDDADKFVLAFASLSHNIHRCDDVAARDLATQIDFKLSALSSGLLSREGFRLALLDAVTENRYAAVVYVSTAASVVALSSALRLDLGASAVPSACTQFASV